MRAAGVDAVADLRARADAAVEAEHVREHLGQLVRGRRADVDLAAGVLVLPGDLQHLRVDARQDAREHRRAEPLQVAHAHALDRLRDPLAQLVGGGVGRAAQAELHVRPRAARASWRRLSSPLR